MKISQNTNLITHFSSSNLWYRIYFIPGFTLVQDYNTQKLNINTLEIMMRLYGFYYPRYDQVFWFVHVNNIISQFEIMAYPAFEKPSFATWRSLKEKWTLRRQQRQHPTFGVSKKLRFVSQVPVQVRCSNPTLIVIACILDMNICFFVCV